MKKIMRPLALLLAILMLANLAGCFGNFRLVNKLYNFNKSVGKEPAQTIVLWILAGCQVYTVSAIADMLVLNTIEYWSGDNPLAMKAGEEQSLAVKGQDGANYTVTARQNRFDIDREGTMVSVVYNPADNGWYVESNGVRTLAARQNGDVVTMYSPNGRSFNLYLQ